MKINEIFYSIQGEGKWIGLPNIFIRTTGCNLRCAYCDTKYAYESGKEMKINEILNEISKYDCKYVCLTGGEPLFQENIIELIKNLIKNDYFVIIETNGSISIKDLIKFKKLIISLDIKCPSSKMDKRIDFKNIGLLRKNDQIKFIVKDKKDYNYAKKIINENKPICDIFIQPVWGESPKKIANWIVKDRLNVRYSLQLHKLIWGQKRRV
jgi:7-carboxy-7-deazaguanine synthase